MQGEVDPGQSAEDLAVAARSSDSPLIGRDSEVEVLRRLISESGGGDGARVCVLTGEAGVGKSRLLREAARVGAGLGCTILFGEAHEYDNAIAYSAVNDAITSLDTTGLAADVRRHRAAVLDVTGAGRPESNPREVTARLLDLARCVLSRGPLLVILDDAHLADDSSLTVWSLMARYLRTEALTMVTGVRLDKWAAGSSFAATLGRVTESMPGEVLSVDPLSQEDIKEFVQVMVGAEPDARLAAHIYAQSCGNPLFAREAVESLASSGDLLTRRGYAFVRGIRGPVVVSRRGALLHRVFRQSERSRQVARVLSAFGRVSPGQIDLVSQLTGLTVQETQAAFDELAAAGIVASDGGGFFSLSHPLLVEVLYDDLGPIERRRIHQLLGNQLAVTDDASLFQWARHVTESADAGDEVAAGAALQAASAVRHRAPAAAGLWYERALRLLPPGDERRGELLARQATSYWKGARPELAVRAGIAAVETLPPGPLRAATLRSAVSAAYVMGHLQQALELFDLDDGSGGPALCAQRAVVCAQLGLPEDANRLSDQAWAQVESCELPEQAVAYSFLSHRAHLNSQAGQYQRALRSLCRIGRSTELAAPKRLSALETAGYMCAFDACAAQAAELLEEADRIYARTGWHDIGGQSTLAHANVAFWRGDWDEALRLVTTGAVDLEVAGHAYNLAWLRLVEANIALERGQLDDAQRVLDETVPPEAWTHFSAWVEIRQAQLSQSRGQFEEADALLTATAGRARSYDWPQVEHQALYSLIVGWLHAGRPAALGESARTASERLDELSRQHALRNIEWTAEFAGALTGRSARPDALAGILQQAESEDMLYLAGQAELALACLGPDQQQRLQAAFSVFADIGAVAWAGLVQAEARARGVVLKRPRPAPPSGALSESEKMLVVLVRDGLNNREIAEALHYSRKTVEAYLSRLYRKTGTRSRTSLVMAVGIQLGDIGSLRPSTRAQL